ncbi:MAG TPA: hypothetical protein PK513_07105 [Alphaproteobacteria bacterium]|nr:hypothetical protein [Alphaproteobacteria bacterium]USO05504.1 MAG: hypothetical protein H6859_10305 [Rhodospirillales bacterium]HOO82254.1 hypothetical protein [Alphaproteobacteria bacterium]
MRQFLVGFLTLVMLTPSLVCGMADCPMPMQAEKKPCHQSGDMDDDMQGKDGPMLAADCMGVDFFQVDVSNDIQPDLSVDSVDYAWIDLVTDYNFQTDNINGIRGPPGRMLDPRSQPSLILITQRFRI